MQRERGIDDSPERAFADLAANGHDFDREWARAYFSRAETDVFEWLRGLGVVFSEIKHFESDSVPRFHRPLNGGAGLMQALWEHAQRRGLDRAWRFGHRVVDLVLVGGVARGVVCERQDGSRIELHGGAIVMATGGFAANVEMVRQHATWLGDVSRVLGGGGPGAQGEGLTLLARHGARIDHLADLYCYATGVPDYQDPEHRRGVVIRATTGWVWLNRAGGRFHNESHTTSGNVSLPRLLGQAGHTAWAIFDESMVADLAMNDHYVPVGEETLNEAAIRHLRHSPYVWRAATLAELCERAGIDGAGAVRTVEAWNALLGSGATHDPLTGRALKGLRPIATPPFYAMQLFPIARKSMGGVRTDMSANVLREDGKPFPGLYAAGELTGMGGGHLAGVKPLEGMMVGGSCFSGRIAGASAARFAMQGSGARFASTEVARR